LAKIPPNNLGFQKAQNQMVEISVTVSWQRNLQNPVSEFLAHKYSRGHSWCFDGGAEINASASPDIVPLPWSVAENVDPEEAFVASLSSCHMLFFIDFAARQGLKLDTYQDHAQGFMGQNNAGKTIIDKVILNPVVTLTEALPANSPSIADIHRKAHDCCFIANSVLAEVIINSSPGE